jgi:hypothetical protein
MCKLFMSLLHMTLNTFLLDAFIVNEIIIHVCNLVQACNDGQLTVDLSFKSKICRPVKVIKPLKA